MQFSIILNFGILTPRTKKLTVRPKRFFVLPACRPVLSDHQMSCRVHYAGLNVTRPEGEIGKYKSIPHHHRGEVQFLGRSVQFSERGMGAHSISAHRACACLHAHLQVQATEIFQGAAAPGWPQQPALQSSCVSQQPLQEHHCRAAPWLGPNPGLLSWPNPGPSYSPRPTGTTPTQLARRGGKWPGFEEEENKAEEERRIRIRIWKKKIKRQWPMSVNCSVSERHLCLSVCVFVCPACHSQLDGMALEDEWGRSQGKPPQHLSSSDVLLQSLNVAEPQKSLLCPGPAS